MPEQRLDRRVGRTRRCLKEALLALIDERGYDAITIADITHRADVGRSTFYSHFTSKEDLLFSGFDHWLRSLADASVPDERGARDDTDPGPRFRFSLPLLHHIRQQRRFFRASIARGSDVRIRQRTTAMLVELVQLELERLRGSQSAENEGKQVRAARAHCIVGGFLGLVSCWLDTPNTLSVAQVNAVFQRVVHTTF